MDSFSQLPDELLSMIIWNIQSHKDVVSLALQNHRFYSLGDLHHRRQFHRVRVLPIMGGADGLRKLLHILQRPHLGHYVRHLELDLYVYLYGQAASIDRNQLTPFEIELLKAAIKAAGFANSTEDERMLKYLFPGPGYLRPWDDTSLNQSLELMAALLASVCRNIETIACSDPGHYEPKMHYREDEPILRRRFHQNPGSRNFLGQFLQRASFPEGNSSYLGKVRTVHFLSDTTIGSNEAMYAGIDHYHCLNIIRRLPALESVTFDASTDGPISIRPPPFLGNYSKITINHSSISSTVLKDIIYSSRALKEFTLSFGGRSTHRLYFDAVDLHGLLKALLAHRQTLERLDLDMESHVNGYSYFGESSTEALSGFTDREDIATEIQYQEEWADELPETALSKEDQIEIASKEALKSLRGFPRLKHLSIGIYSMYYLAHGIEKDRIEGNAFSLVDRLPPALESLRIYGYGQTSNLFGTFYEHVRNLHVEEHVSQMMSQKEEKLPKLGKIEGINPNIPNGMTVRNPDENCHLLWRQMREERLDKQYHPGGWY